jgi:hypothetical protein
MGESDHKGTTGLEGIIFDNNNYNQPSKTHADDVFGNGMLMPENSKKPVVASNPFDAFNAQVNPPAQSSNPFGSDVFSQNNAFQNNTQANTGFGNIGKTDWNAGFTSEFSSNSAFAAPGAFANQKQPSSDFSGLNPFGYGEQPAQAAKKPAGAALPPGVNGFDLFQ